MAPESLSTTQNSSSGIQSASSALDSKKRPVFSSYTICFLFTLEIMVPSSSEDIANGVVLVRKAFFGERGAVLNALTLDETSARTAARIVGFIPIIILVELIYIHNDAVRIIKLIILVGKLRGRTIIRFAFKQRSKFLTNSGDQ